ncbi:vesicular glutamate transporter 3 [Caerostris extrusa]|uniref:Vesicular glutamate transporter 3 n=1 Tax=Caerostris extrusa TaxID=172846 RepID=A0AAV4QWG1_CAEEX|nr:vesicular glutamate transporter 3 [Caerostris extrusa]
MSLGAVRFRRSRKLANSMIAQALSSEKDTRNFKENGRVEFYGCKLKGQDDEKGFMKDDELGGNDLYEELQRKKPRSRGFMEPECPCCKNLSKRYTIALLSSLGFVISFGIRCNLSNAIVKMVEPVDGNPPEFDWTSGTIGVMDSSFFWGYLVTQIPGGFLATKYPANRIFGTAIAISAFLNLLIPKSAQIHASMVMVVRILQGLVEKDISCKTCSSLKNIFQNPLLNIFAFLANSRRIPPLFWAMVQRFAKLRKFDKRDQVQGIYHRISLQVTRVWDGQSQHLLLPILPLSSATQREGHKYRIIKHFTAALE